MNPNTQNESLLRLSALSVSVDGTPLLRGIELDVQAGELVGLSGPSGCGKTTLLRAIACLSDAAGGRVSFQGRLPQAVGWPAYRRQVLLVPQRPVMFEGTVQSNLERSFRYKSAQSAFSPEDAQTLLDRLSVGAGRLSQDARSLSEGQQQRVAIIRALLVKPSVLLLDEPTSALDAKTRDAVESLIRERLSGGMGVLAVTHDAAQAERWCDRQYALDQHIADAGEGKEGA